MLGSRCLLSDWCLKPAGPEEVLTSSRDLAGNLVQIKAGSRLHSAGYLGSCIHTMRIGTTCFLFESLKRRCLSCDLHDFTEKPRQLVTFLNKIASPVCQSGSK